MRAAAAAIDAQPSPGPPGSRSLGARRARAGGQAAYRGGSTGELPSTEADATRHMNEARRQATRPVILEAALMEAASCPTK